MTTDLLEKRIRAAEKAKDRKGAIHMVAAPLLENGSIRASYTDAMIHNVEVDGPYIAIIPDVAMLHSRVEDGAPKMDTFILKLEDGVAFPQDNIVHLIIVLSANDNDAHMWLLSDMVDVLMDEDKMNDFLHTEYAEGVRRVPA